MNIDLIIFLSIPCQVSCGYIDDRLLDHSIISETYAGPHNMASDVIQLVTLNTTNGEDQLRGLVTIVYKSLNSILKIIGSYDRIVGSHHTILS